MLNNVNIITWNARGIKQKSIELFSFLINKNINICLVTETWLKTNISLSHNSFKIYRNDRENRNGGGVAIIVNINISHILLPIV